MLLPGNLVLVADADKPSWEDASSNPTNDMTGNVLGAVAREFGSSSASVDFGLLSSSSHWTESPKMYAMHFSTKTITQPDSSRRSVKVLPNIRYVSSVAILVNGQHNVRNP